VTAELGERLFIAVCKVKIVKELKTGVYTGLVLLAYYPLPPGTNIETDVNGYYSIDSRPLKSGKHWVSALKMVGTDAHWATDDDLMDPGSARPEVHPPLTVTLPISAQGQEINDLKLQSFCALSCPTTRRVGATRVGATLRVAGPALYP